MMLTKTAAAAEVVGRRLNWVVERVCALLLAVLVLVIWFEIFQRYVLRLGMTWGEEFSRFVMIWTALLAVPCGAYRREHIGLEVVSNLLSDKSRRRLRFFMDLIGLGFFMFLAVYGIGMAAGGRSQYATIFGMTMAVPFASVPVCGVLTSVQIAVSLLRDFAPAGSKEEGP